MTPSTRQRLRLIEIGALGPANRHLVLEAVGRTSFSFEPGQHLCLKKAFDGRSARRHFSIASAPNGGNCVELCVGVDTHSAFGRYLGRVGPGDEIEYEGPAGNFRLRKPLQDSIFVAGGTGISPIRSMLQHLIGGETDRSARCELTLIYGARHPEQIFYREEFESLPRRRPNFQFWPTLSGPSHGWAGRSGYVQTHLAEVLRGRTHGVDVYLCGRRAMIEEALQLLDDVGLDENSIIYEKYG